MNTPLLKKKTSNPGGDQANICGTYAENLFRASFGTHLQIFSKIADFSSIFLGPTTFFPKMQTFSTENLGPTNFFPRMQIFSIENLGPTYNPTLKNHRNSEDGCRLQYQSFRGINAIKFSVSY